MNLIFQMTKAIDFLLSKIKNLKVFQIEDEKRVFWIFLPLLRFQILYDQGLGLPNGILRKVWLNTDTNINLQTPCNMNRNLGVG